MRRPFGIVAALFFLALVAPAQDAGSVLIVVNSNAPISKTVGEYYARKRSIPARNICTISAPVADEISRPVYDAQIAKAVAQCLVKGLRDRVLYIVVTAGVPLRIKDSGSSMMTRIAAVDSELTLLYSDMAGRPHPLDGPLVNPFFAKTGARFRHPDFPIYLVTRLDGFDFGDIRGLIDRALVARNTGKFVLDLRADEDTPGNSWLRAAAAALPKSRVVIDESAKVLTGVQDVIGYASWGSNDRDRHKRDIGFRWLPGAIMTEYVSTNGRTFQRPPDTWEIGTWKDRQTYFAGAPQTLTADYIHQGVTGASGHVAEPYLQLNPRPDILLPAYYSGRNLAESYYLSIPALSWQNIVVGDPLCSLGKP